MVSIDQPNNTGAIYLKMDESVLDRKSSFKMLRLTVSSKLIGAQNYIQENCAKTTSKKIGSLICFLKLHSPDVALISQNLPYHYA